MFGKNTHQKEAHVGQEHPVLLLGKNDEPLALFCAGQAHRESCIHFSMSQFQVLVDSVCALLESTQVFFTQVSTLLKPVMRPFGKSISSL